MQKRPEARKRAHTFGEKVFAVECEQKSEKERERVDLASGHCGRWHEESIEIN